MEFIESRIKPLKEKLLAYHERYQAYLPAIFFAAGFILDILTLGEIDDWSNIIILTTYLVLSIVILSFEYQQINRIESSNKIVLKFFEYRHDIFHFFLGALLSAFTLFYFKSSSLSNSFFFMFFMMGILLFNETEIFQKNGIIVRSTLIMLALISYLILIIPTFVGSTGIVIFAICIVIALLCTGIAFYLMIKQGKAKGLYHLVYPHALVALLFVILYGAKILPPVPLSIKYIGIYHEVKKKDGQYIALTQKPSWNFWSHGDQEFKARPGDKVFVFTSIFSPAGFAGKIYIKWFQDINDEWTMTDRIPLSITGGRTEGFRGYAFKANYQPGEWQVRVVTEDDLEIGRINFTITADTTVSARTLRAEAR